MRPEVAIQKVHECAEQIFSSNFSVSLEWLNHVNRYLWVLTSGTVVRLDPAAHQKMNRICETVKAVYQSCQFAVVDPASYAYQDPRKGDLSLKELLLQILGRCKLLEELFQTSLDLERSKVAIDELKRQFKDASKEEEKLKNRLEMAQSALEQLKRELAGAHEEESRLHAELGRNRDVLRQVQKLHEEKCEELLKKMMFLLAEKDEQIATDELVIKLLRVERDKLANDLGHEKKGNASMQDLLEEREETIQKLRKKMASANDDEKVKEVEVVVVRQDADVQCDQLTRIKEIVDRTAKQYDETAQTEPLLAAEALYRLMTDLKEILR